jgi:outer membrane biosynthesis protein TonB
VDWLEQNLDAYRIIAEILKDLRELLRASLEKNHGKEWYKSSLPEGLLEQLVQIKEQEKAIDWYESEYQEIMSYAVFPDLLNILEANADAFPAIMDLAPTGALLHARFLELEVMRSKLGRARPISDTELAFLGTFHLRFRRAIDDLRSATPDKAESAGPSAPKEDPQPPQPPATTLPPAKEQAPVQPPAPTPEPEKPTPAEAKEDDPEPTAERPPQREAQSDVDQGSGAPDKVGSAQTGDPAPPPADATAEPAADEESAPPQETSFEESLENGDDRAILRALYLEVTNTAEGIWTKEVLPNTQVWDLVRASVWYEDGFSRLGLKPVSDFYEIMSKVDAKMRKGATKPELQEELKKSNFAQILLALRDMFQSHAI